MKWIPRIYILLLLILHNPVSAQKGVKFGFRAGYSMATQYGILAPDLPYSVDVYYRHGLAGGLLIYYPITESFGMQQEFLFVQKGSREDIDLKDRPINTRTEYDLNYFEIPMLIRYSFAQMGDFTLYGSSGFVLSILLNGDYRLSGVAKVDGVPVSFYDVNKIKGIDVFDYAFLYGAGVESTILGKECFFEYRFTIGWNVLMMPTAEGEDPAPLRNLDYMFTIGMYL
ncbi:MAG: porin family protein [candidate division KSB1 bacterium]|nr:porin family protein [candidate division KSB1 bacterium]